VALEVNYQRGTIRPALTKTMSNTYDISDQDEREIRARDKTCVEPHFFCCSCRKN
jgi:hypothetical protein